MLEQQGRIVPANNRYRAGEASIRSSFRRAGSIAPPLGGPTAEAGGLELSTGTGLCTVRVGRPSVVWLFLR